MDNIDNKDEETTMAVVNTAEAGEEIQTIQDEPTQDEQPKDKHDEMLIGRIFKNDLAQTKDDINKIVAAKIKQRIDIKKGEFIASVRGN